MMTVACKDMGIDCPWVGHGNSIDELVAESKEHARKYHKAYWDETMSKMSDEELKKETKPYVKEA